MIQRKRLMGGKAWSTAEMSALGLNVPPACVTTTRARDEDAHLRRFASWAGELSRIPIMAAHGRGETLDLDQRPGDVASLGPVLMPGSVRNGRIFGNGH